MVRSLAGHELYYEILLEFGDRVSNRPMSSSKKSDRDKNRLTSDTKEGGIAFYFTLLCLIIINAVQLFGLSGILTHTQFSQWGEFVTALLCGGMAAACFINGGFSTFLHEVRHSTVSGLVGNSWGKMHVDGNSGYFQFKYDQRNKHFNALIALAPYYLPVFTVLGAVFMALYFYRYKVWLSMILGFGYGIDLVLNLRDISPIQSDLTRIRGGYSVAVAFIVLAQLALASLVSYWVIAQMAGIRYLGAVYWEIIQSLARAWGT
jgi:hypothetical protein